MTKHKERKKRLILKMKDRVDSSSTIHPIRLGILLQKAINNTITHLTLDFSGVLEFEYTDIELSVAIFELYARDFSEITCCGLPKNIFSVFRDFGVEKIPGLKIATPDDRHT